MKLCQQILVLLWTLFPVYSISESAGGSQPKSAEEFWKMICPKGDKPFIRLKTNRGRYVYALGTSTGRNSYVRTKLSNGATEPGVRTTFKVHCGFNRLVTSEILTKHNVAATTKDNKPSGYFFYGAYNYKDIYAKYYPKRSERGANFALHWVRGATFGMEIESLLNRRWVIPSNGPRGYLSVVRGKKVTENEIPDAEETFSVEIVPEECVEVRLLRDKIQAAPRKTSPTDCEQKPGRCYWNAKTPYSSFGPTCYYKKGSKCFQPYVELRTKCPTDTNVASKCEAADCCYDYARKACFKGK